MGKRIKPSVKDVEVLATLLVAYPQISRVTFDPQKRVLHLVFLCRGPMSPKKRRGMATAYLDSVNVYLDLVSARASTVNYSWEKMGDFYSFTVERDTDTISPGELNVTVEIVQTWADVALSSEDGTAIDGLSDFGMPGRMFLHETLDQVKNLESTRALVAMREGERVLVFDK